MYIKNKKIIGSVLICSLLIIGIWTMFVHKQIPRLTMSEEEIKEHTELYDDGDYIFHPSDDSLTLDEDTGLAYYNGLLDVYLMETITDSDKEKIASYVDGMVVSNISGEINVIQIMVPDFPMSKFEELRDKLYKSDKVYFVSIDKKNNTNISAGEKSEENIPAGNWWIKEVGLDKAWKLDDLVNPINIGIVDNGFEIEHKSFMVDNKSKISMMNNNSPENHGTHVAGIIGAKKDEKNEVRGVADTANLICVDWQDSQGHGFSDVEMVGQTKRLIEAGAKIINNSWSGKLYDKKHFLSSDNTDVDDIAKLSGCERSSVKYSQYLEYKSKEEKIGDQEYLAMLAALLVSDNDVLIVQSAGNGYSEDKETNTGEGYDTSIFEEGYINLTKDKYSEWLENCAPSMKDRLEKKGITFETIKNHIMIVAATTNERDKEYRAKFCPWSNYGDNIDIAAPGDDILSCYMPNTFKTDKGTSMSAPIVAGAAAYIWSLNPSLTATEVKNCLLSTAQRAVGVTGEDAGREYKMLDIGSAATQTVMGSVHISIKDKQSKDSINKVKCEFSSDITDDEFFNSKRESDNEGDVYISGIGTMHITLTKEGYLPVELDVKVGVKEDVEVSVELDKVDWREVFAATLASTNHDLLHFLYDWDEDGVPELFVESGDREDDAYIVYKCSLESGTASKIGMIGWGSYVHNSIAGIEDANAILTVYAHMDHERVSKWVIKNGNITEEVMYEYDYDVLEMDSFWYPDYMLLKGYTYSDIGKWSWNGNPKENNAQRIKDQKAAIKKKSEEDWGYWRKAYKKYIDDHGVANNEYEVVPIDNDSIPELVIYHNSVAEGIDICTFNGSSVKVLNVTSNVSYILYEGLIRAYGYQGDAWNYIYSLKNGKFTLIGGGTYSENEYYWNDKSVSEQEYWNKYNEIFKDSDALADHYPIIGADIYDALEYGD